jgi:hypothetical protein
MSGNIVMYWKMAEKMIQLMSDIFELGEMNGN